jgi:alpha-glucuronidase
MDILAKMKEKNDQFEQLKAGVIERQNKIAQIQQEANAAIQGLNNEVTQITDEMKRVQGEYRLLSEMGIEAGVLDESGAAKAELKLVEAEAVEKVDKPE